MTLLKVENLSKNFGAVTANRNISFEIKKGEILGLIGPNGAGKTTLFHCIVGYFPPDKGRVIFNGHDITGLRPYKTNKIGLARTFQKVRIMKDLSILENVMIGSFCRVNNRLAAQEEAREILKVLGLSKLASKFPDEVQLAIRKKIELARALATKPLLIMLDEVAAGLTPTERIEMLDTIQHIHKEKKLTLLVIEHVMDVVMPISQRVIMMDGGKKIIEDVPEKVINDERVIKAYLGEKYVKR